MIEALRTPDERFSELPDFNYQPRYLDTLSGSEGLRMAYLDEGDSKADKVYLCLHGNPAWSFLYRKMIPVFVADGARVIAPDLFGFGRSDKPVQKASYHFEFHRNSLLELIESLDLQHITLVCQDWGGLLGLTLPMAMPERFERLLVMNTMLATGDAPLPSGFLAWREWCETQPDMQIGKLFRRSHPALTPAEVAAYDAPFPDARHKAGVLAFPPMVCDAPDAAGAALSREARHWWRTQWSGQSFMAVGVEDPVFGMPVMEALRADIRNCPPPLQIANAGHFVQERGEQIATAAIQHWRAG